MFTFEIHSKSDCPWCSEAKSYFTHHNMDYKEYLYDAFDDRQLMYDRFDLALPYRSVPQIFLIQNDRREYIGGYTDLIRANLTERLQMENFDADF